MKTTEADVMKIHEELVVLDGAAQCSVGVWIRLAQ